MNRVGKYIYCHFPKPAWILTAFQILIFIPTDKCRSHPISREHHFKVAGDDHRKPQLVKMWRTSDRLVPSLSLYISNTMSIPKIQETLWKRGKKDSKRQRTRKCPVR